MKEWGFWIDRGGTFTDVIAVDPEGRLRTRKLLSSDDAPAEAVQALLREAGAWSPGAPLPPCTVKLGTTVATNALLERRGVRTLLVTSSGLGDLLAIGTQERPDLFALAIEKPPPLHARALELPGRADVHGRALEAFDEAARARRARGGEARRASRRSRSSASTPTATRAGRSAWRRSRARRASRT